MSLPAKPKISEAEKAKGLAEFIEGKDNPLTAGKQSATAQKESFKEKEDIMPYLMKFPKQLHAETKIICFKKGITMKEYLIQAVKEKNEREK